MWNCLLVLIFKGQEPSNLWHPWYISHSVHAESSAGVRLLDLHGLQPARLLSLGFLQEYWRLPCPSFRGSSPPRVRLVSLCVSSVAGRFFIHWATWEAHRSLLQVIYLWLIELMLLKFIFRFRIYTKPLSVKSLKILFRYLICKMWIFSFSTL